MSEVLNEVNEVLHGESEESPTNTSTPVPVKHGKKDITETIANINKRLQDIQKKNKATNAKLDAICDKLSKLDLIEQKLSNMEMKVTQMESKVNSVEQKNEEMENSVAFMSSKFDENCKHVARPISEYSS